LLTVGKNEATLFFELLVTTHYYVLDALFDLFIFIVLNVVFGLYIYIYI